MKQVLFAAATVWCCVLLSCQNAANNNMADSQTEKNKIAVRDVYQGIQTGDITKLSVIADDAVDHAGPNGQEIKGGDNIKKMLADMHNHIKDLKVEIVADAADGDYVFTWCRMTGTAVDSSMGMAPGTNLDSKCVDVVKFKDGKATDHWCYMDPKEMMKMMPHPSMDSTHKM